MLTFEHIGLLSHCRVALIVATSIGWGVVPVWAQESGKLYVGAGLGVADYQGGYEGIAYGDSPLGGHLYGGFQLRDRVAVELALTSFAAIRSGDILGSGLDRLRISADYQSIAVRGMFRLPLGDLVPRWGKWTVFGTAGVYSSQERRHVVELVSAQTSDDVTDDSGLMLGAGAIYRFSKVGVRASLTSIGGRHADQSALEVAAEFRF